MRLLQYLESSLRKGISPFRYNAASSVYFTFSIPRCLAMGKSVRRLHSAEYLLFLMNVLHRASYCLPQLATIF